MLYMIGIIDKSISTTEMENNEEKPNARIVKPPSIGPKADDSFVKNNLIPNLLP